MKASNRWARRPAIVAGVLALAAIVPAAASAHARISPAVSLSGKLQLYSLAVPTEKERPHDVEDRVDGPGRVRDRLVRPAAGRVDSAGAADRVGRQRRDHEGDVDGREDPDR